MASARKGDFREAEEGYRREVEYLFGAERKQEMAEIYLEFADAAFEPKDAEEEPDYEKALTFYRQALEVGPKSERRIEIELRVARCRQELGKTSDAAELYEDAFARSRGHISVGATKAAELCFSRVRSDAIKA